MLGRDVQRVAGALGDQDRRRARAGRSGSRARRSPATYPCSVPVTPGGRRVGPEQADQGVGRDRAAAVQRERGEQGPLLARAEVDRVSVEPGLGRAQYAHPHARKNRPPTAAAAEGLPERTSNRCSKSAYAGPHGAALRRARNRLVTPPGWPRQVRPPGAPGWEHTAVAWLLDICPPEFRSYPVLRRHDVVLARFAVLHVEACQAAVRRGLSEARAALRDVADLAAVDAAVEAWQARVGAAAGGAACGRARRGSTARAPVRRPAVACRPMAQLRVVPVPGDGAEDVVVDAEGWVYTGTADGSVFRVHPDGRAVDLVGRTGGRPMGLELLPTGGCWSATRSGTARARPAVGCGRDPAHRGRRPPAGLPQQRHRAQLR